MKANYCCLFLGVLIVILFGGAGEAVAEWPYMAEEASNLSGGQYSLSFGVGWRDQREEVRYYNGPLLSRPAGTYWAVPEVQGTLGVGRRAELSFDYQFFHFRAAEGGDEMWESGDLRVWSKLGLLRGVGQDVSLRFGVKLPNSTHLGTNETDFLLSGLYDLHLGDCVFTANLGLGVIGNPALNRTQDDVLVWAAALGYQPAGDGLQAGVEASGSRGPYGVGRRRQASTYAAVVGWQRGRWRTDATLRYGADDAKGWGWLGGVTYGY